MNERIDIKAENEYVVQPPRRTAPDNQQQFGGLHAPPSPRAVFQQFGGLNAPPSPRAVFQQQLGGTAAPPPPHADLDEHIAWLMDKLYAGLSDEDIDADHESDQDGDEAMAAHESGAQQQQYPQAFEADNSNQRGVLVRVTFPLNGRRIDNINFNVNFNQRQANGGSAANLAVAVAPIIAAAMRDEDVESTTVTKSKSDRAPSHRTHKHDQVFVTPFFRFPFR